MLVPLNEVNDMSSEEIEMKRDDFQPLNKNRQFEIIYVDMHLLPI